MKINKLTDEQRNEIRVALESGKDAYELAKAYGTSISTVRRIRRTIEDKDTSLSLTETFQSYGIKMPESARSADNILGEKFKQFNPDSAYWKHEQVPFSTSTNEYHIVVSGLDAYNCTNLLNTLLKSIAGVRKNINSLSVHFIKTEYEHRLTLNTVEDSEGEIKHLIDSLATFYKLSKEIQPTLEFNMYVEGYEYRDQLLDAMVATYTDRVFYSTKFVVLSGYSYNAKHDKNRLSKFSQEPIIYYAGLTNQQITKNAISLNIKNSYDFIGIHIADDRFKVTTLVNKSDV